MNCPNCGTRLPEGALVCPACHFDLGRTSVLPKLQGRWCPSCGSLIPDGAQVCPHCGLPQPSALSKTMAPRPKPAKIKVNEDIESRLPKIEKAPDAERLPSPEELEAEKAETHAIPRIESAIPSEPDAYSDAAQHEHIPHIKVMVATAAAAILLVGGVVLGITHPWDPEAFATKAKVPADTSHAGSVAEVQELSQDESSQQQSISGDEYSYQQLEGYWEQLGKLSDSLDKNEDTFNSTAISGDAAARSKGKDEAESLGYQVSNLITAIQQVDTTSGTYADTVKDLSTLGNYLRNRSDALNQGWKLSVSSDDPASDADSIKAPVTSSDSYKKLFSDAYQDAKPKEAS